MRQTKRYGMTLMLALGAAASCFAVVPLKQADRDSVVPAETIYATMDTTDTGVVAAVAGGRQYDPEPATTTEAGTSVVTPAIRVGGPDGAPAGRATVCVETNCAGVRNGEPLSPDHGYHRKRERHSVFPALSLSFGIAGLIGHLASLMIAVSTMGDGTTWFALAVAALALDVGAVACGALGMNKRNNTPAIIGFIFGAVNLTPLLIAAIVAVFQ